MTKKKPCDHAVYATVISARKRAEELGLKNPWRAAKRCDACGKWRVVV